MHTAIGSGLPKLRDPRCRVKRGSVRLKRHVGPESDADAVAKIAMTAALMAEVARAAA